MEILINRIRILLHYNTPLSEIRHRCRLYGDEEIFFLAFCAAKRLVETDKEKECPVRLTAQDPGLSGS